MSNVLWEMKLFFQHVYGRMSDASVIFCEVLANFDPEEETYALENGWFVYEWSNEKPTPWVQGRQTRLEVSKLKHNKKTRKMIKPCAGIESTFKPLKESNLEDLERVYRAYATHRGFEHDMQIKDLYLDLQNKYILEHRDEGVLRAFTICRVYDNSPSMTSIQFCWDYHKPKMFLGKYSMIKELEIARERGFDYIYLMPAYEDICIYKSYFQGFEFWDGTRWSSDRDMFIRMCENDSKVNTIKDVDKLMWNYEKNYFRPFPNIKRENLK